MFSFLFLLLAKTCFHQFSKLLVQLLYNNIFSSNCLSLVFEFLFHFLEFLLFLILRIHLLTHLKGKLAYHLLALFQLFVFFGYLFFFLFDQTVFVLQLSLNLLQILFLFTLVLKILKVYFEVLNISLKFQIS